MAKAARSFRLQDFYATFNEIKGIDHKCAEYLLDIGLHHWARAYFPGKRYDVMTSNLPVIRLDEFIRSKLMTWFASRREKANNCTSPLSPRVLGMLTKNFEKSGGYDVLQIADKEYEVREKEGGGFHVNLTTMTCSCFAFQTLAIPCSHSISAALKAKISVESLAAEAYGVTQLRAAYGGSIYPVDGYTGAANLESNVNGIHIYPPSTRRPPRRPKKAEIFLKKGESGNLQYVSFKH